MMDCNNSRTLVWKTMHKNEHTGIQGVMPFVDFIPNSCELK